MGKGREKVYKIMDLNSGLYSNGGQSPQFTRNGKSWSNLGHIKSHLAQFKNTSPDRHPYMAEDLNVKVMVYEMVEVDCINPEELN